MPGNLAVANEQLAQNIVEAENDHEYDRMFSVVAEHFELHRPRRGGRTTLRHLAEAFYRGFPDHVRHIERLRPGDRFVVVRWRLAGTHLGPFAGMEPTGRRVALHGSSIWEIVDLRLVGAWCFADGRELAGQLMSGTGPSPRLVVA